VFSLRIRLRAKDKEIKELVSRLILRGQELDSARGRLGDGEKTVRALRESLNESEKNLSGLRAEKGKLEERLASLIARQTRAMAGKENEIASLDKKNKALLKSVEKFKRSARNLERKNIKLAQPRLPKELREKLKEFGAK
jgi:chromosome segregation ATPase